MREEGGRSSSSRLRKIAKKMIVVAASACASFSRKKALVDPIAFDHSTIAISNSTSISGGSRSVSPMKPRNTYRDGDCEEDDIVVAGESISDSLPSAKSLCAICLDPLNYGSSKSSGTSRSRGSGAGAGSGQAIFTAQCSHGFHFACIASNVRHGSVTCPICRAHWTQLPRHLSTITPPTATANSDPILRILDDSIATFRVHRRSFLRSARYDDDDPVDPPEPLRRPRLLLSLAPSDCGAHLSVRLAGPCPTDLVLVASPNGPHLRLLKQCMALAVFSLRPVDRLAIVTYSATAARVFPLRRMTPDGKRAALRVVDRLFYMGRADPGEGLEKAAKILRDRAHRNPEAAILHLSDSPASAAAMEDVGAIPMHQFHVGSSSSFGGISDYNNNNNNGAVMNEFGEFLAGLLGGSHRAVSDLQLRVRAGGGEEPPNGLVVRIGELRGGEERQILLDVGESGHVFVEYSYCEDDGDGDERFVRGERVVSVGDGKSSTDAVESAAATAVGIGGGGGCGGRLSVESWDYHDPYMARRWAKHLHCYRL